MVLTSQRAVEAMELCVANFISHEGECHGLRFKCLSTVWYLGCDINYDSFLFPVWRNKVANLWQEKAIFVVGKATAKAGV